jgi:hypothetical protein
MDHGAIDLESAGDVGLAAKQLDKTLHAVHPPSLACQTEFDNPPFLPSARRTIGLWILSAP